MQELEIVELVCGGMKHGEVIILYGAIMYLMSVGVQQVNHHVQQKELNVHGQIIQAILLVNHLVLIQH